MHARDFQQPWRHIQHTIMEQFQEYSLAWTVYFLASIGLAVLGWWMCRRASLPYLRHMWVLFILVFLLTPAMTDNQYWAPAWIVTALQLLFGDVSSAVVALRLLIVVGIVVLIFYSIVAAILQAKGVVSPFTKRSKNISENSSDASQPSSKESQRISPRIS